MTGARARAGAAASIALLVAVGLASCGVETDESARTIDKDDVPFGLLEAAPETTTTVAAPSTTASVFLVSEDRVASVTRNVSATGVSGVLAALERGATDAEAAQGLRSAVPSAGIERAEVLGATAEVELGSSFTTLDPAEQLLAIAQIVYTATALPDIDSVRFQLQGRAVEVPTDGANLAARPVTRSDYQSVAPA